MSYQRHEKHGISHTATKYVCLSKQNTCNDKIHNISYLTNDSLVEMNVKPHLQLARQQQ